MVRRFRIIELLKNFIRWVCRLILRCKILKYIMGNLLSAPEPAEYRELKLNIGHRKILDETLQKIGKQALIECNSTGSIKRTTLERLNNLLSRVDGAHLVLIHFFKRFLPQDAVPQIFLSEKLHGDVAILKNENKLLKHAKLQLQQNYEGLLAKRWQESNEEYGKSPLQKNLQQTNLEILQPHTVSKERETEEARVTQASSLQNLKLNVLQYKKENAKLRQQVVDATTKEQDYLKKVTFLEGNLSYVMEEKSNLKLEVLHLRRHFQENNITQQNLKRQLSATTAELEIFKRNNDLAEACKQYEEEKVVTYVENEKVRDNKHVHRSPPVVATNHPQNFSSTNSNLNALLQKAEQDRRESTENYYQNDRSIASLQNELLKRDGLIKQLIQRVSTVEEERDNFKTEVARLRQEIQQQYSRATEIINTTRSDNLAVIERLQADLSDVAKERDSFGAVIEELQQVQRQSMPNQVEEREICNGQTESVEDHESVDQGVQPGYVQECLNKIGTIVQEVQVLEEEICQFSGTEDDKTFLHLQELLIRSVVKLDNVETEGNFSIRKERKDAIAYVQTLLNILKAKQDSQT